MSQCRGRWLVVRALEYNFLTELSEVRQSEKAKDNG